MRKQAKRLTALVLSLVMVFACAMQTGAEEGAGQVPETIVLKGNKSGGSGGIDWLDDLGLSYEEDDTGETYGYTVDINESSGDITITPGVKRRFKLSFGVARTGSQTVKIKSTDYSDGFDNAIARETPMKGYMLYTLVDISLLRTSSAEDTSLEISAEISTSHKVTFLTENALGLRVEGADTALESVDYKFDVYVSNEYHSQGYVPKVMVKGVPKPSAGEPTQVESEWKYTYSLGILDEDTTVQVGLVKKQCTIMIVRLHPETFTDTAAGEHDDRLSVTTVDYGGSYSFYVEPEEGYNAPKVVDMYMSVGSVGSVQRKNTTTGYTFSNITANLIITITGEASKIQEPITFNKVDGVTYLAGGEGEVEITPGPGSDQTVAHGDKYTFRLKLKEGYTKSIPQVTANGKIVPVTDQGKGTQENGFTYTYTLDKVVEPKEINVTGVELNTYTVTFSNGEYSDCSISSYGATKATVRHGESIVFQVNLAPKYTKFNPAEHISVVIDGKSESDGNMSCVIPLGNGNYQLLRAVKADITVTLVKLTQNQCAIIYPAEQTGYKISEDGDGGQSVEYGESVTFKLKAKPGYQIVNVTYTMNGKVYTPAITKTDEDGTTTYQINDIIADVTVNVTVREIEITVIYSESKAPAESRITSRVYKVSGLSESGLKYSYSMNGGLQLYLPEKSFAQLPAYYSLDGWYSDGEEITSITIGNSDKTISLEAKYKVNYEKLFSLTLDGEAIKRQEQKFSLILSALWRADDIEELKGQEVTVEDSGFFMSEQSFTIEQKFVEDALTRVEGMERQMVKVSSKQGIYIFNFESSTSLNGKFTKGFSNVQENEGLYVLAYVHVRFGSGDEAKDYYYYSDGTATAGIDGQSDDGGTQHDSGSLTHVEAKTTDVEQEVSP